MFIVCVRCGVHCETHTHTYMITVRIFGSSPEVEQNEAIVPMWKTVDSIVCYVCDKISKHTHITSTNICTCGSWCGWLHCERFLMRPNICMCACMLLLVLFYLWICLDRCHIALCAYVITYIPSTNWLLSFWFWIIRLCSKVCYLEDA